MRPAVLMRGRRRGQTYPLPPPLFIPSSSCMIHLCLLCSGSQVTTINQITLTLQARVASSRPTEDPGMVAEGNTVPYPPPLVIHMFGALVHVYCTLHSTGLYFIQTAFISQARMAFILPPKRYVGSPFKLYRLIVRHKKILMLLRRPPLRVGRPSATSAFPLP